MAQVVELADKHMLLHVLDKCQAWVQSEVPLVAPNVFPRQATPEGVLRALQLRETFLRCGVPEADGAMERLMLRDLCPQAPADSRKRGYCAACG